MDDLTIPPKQVIRKPLKGEIVSIRLEDELPRIGCGVRRVIIQRGRKWMRIEEVATGKRGKLPIATKIWTVTHGKI